jgi:hypothetical protein
VHEDPARDPEDVVVSHFSSTAPGAQQSVDLGMPAPAATVG